MRPDVQLLGNMLEKMINVHNLLDRPAANHMQQFVNQLCLFRWTLFWWQMLLYFRSAASAVQPTSSACLSRLGGFLVRFRPLRT